METFYTAGQATDDNMAHAHCKLEAQVYKYTHTHSGCVTLIVFPLQHCLHGRPSNVRYTQIACLVDNTVVLIHHLLFIPCYAMGI